MNHFEYLVELPVSEDVERVTNDIYNMIKEGRCPFSLSKVVDEGEGDKKRRLFVITSPVNIHHIVHPMFYKFDMKVLCYFKTPVAF
jgi:hypothetical protein|uniref:Uncharacterized protein n=1 Tax=viral metagenome TaxID=1070528 RepID=A0A6C0LJE2_9ZZZZ